MWNPETDPYIPTRYSAGEHRAQIREQGGAAGTFLAAQDLEPVVAYVGRLDEQKGMHLVHHALFHTLAAGGQFVLMVQAQNHDGINGHFQQLKDHLNDNQDCHLELSYQEELAHLVFAGADLLVVPSLFEPCGLVPLIAMRYGTVPVVRATGGMRDTVFDRDHSERPAAERNGYVFHHTDNRAIESALSRALRLWFARPARFPYPGRQRHARRLLVAPPRPGLPRHLRARPAPVSPRTPAAPSPPSKRRGPAYPGALSDARSPGTLISTTGQAAPAAQRWLTEPSRSPAQGDRPRVPTTSRSA